MLRIAAGVLLLLAVFAIFKVASADLRMADRWQSYQEIQAEEAANESVR